MKIKEIQKGLINKKFSSVEITDFFLKKIKEEDKKISSFLSVYKKESLKQAEKADKKIFQKENTPLTGIPLSIKDNILVKRMRCTCASKMMENYVSPYDADVVKKLKKESSVILGKTNLDEFSMGGSTEKSAFFVTKNPHDLSRIPGGSSGGSAASVAANFCCFSLGSDTGGSIREPASFCGVVGLKPTHKAVSQYGLIPLASSFDQIGPITKTVEDAEIVFNSIKSVNCKNSSFSKLTIGLPEECFGENLDKKISEKIEEVVKKISKKNIKIKKISLPNNKYSLAAYHVIMEAEAFTNMGRYDGLRYGYHDLKAKNTEDSYFKNRKNGLGYEVKRRILFGAHVISHNNYEKYYNKALKAKQLIKNDFFEAFKDVDLIITPTSPIFPMKIGERDKDPLSMYFTEIFTDIANLAGLPAISIPLKKINNLPAGIQLIGNHFQENLIFLVGKKIEKIIED